MRQMVLFVMLCCASAVFSTVCAQEKGERRFSDHYYKRYAEFEKEKPIGNQDIVFLGNSLTEGGEWSKYFAETQARLVKKGGAIRNRGIVGDDAVGMYERLHQILPGKPKKMFLLVGVNDISHHISADSVLVLVDKVVGKIRGELPQTKLYLQSLLPINGEKNRYKTMTGKAEVIREVNTGLERMAKRYGIKFINLYEHFTVPHSTELKPELTSDGLHINKEGYVIWVQQIKKYVK